MEYLDENYEFRSICSDLINLFDRAKGISDQLHQPQSLVYAEICAQFAVLKECIMEGTQYLQNSIFNLDLLGGYKISQLGEAEAKNHSIADAMGDWDFKFLSDSMREYAEYRDGHED